MKQIADCPRCKARCGWYEKRLTAWRQYYTPDGESSHATDGDTVGKGGRQKYCYECGRIITKLVVE